MRATLRVCQQALALHFAEDGNKVVGGRNHPSRSADMVNVRVSFGCQPYVFEKLSGAEFDHQHGCDLAREIADRFRREGKKRDGPKHPRADSFPSSRINSELRYAARYPVGDDEHISVLGKVFLPGTLL